MLTVDSEAKELEIVKGRGQLFGPNTGVLSSYKPSPYPEQTPPLPTSPLLLLQPLRLV